MQRIIYHWTAGNYNPNATDLSAYHYVIDGTGKIHEGRHKPEANLNIGSRPVSTYAAHTGGLNTGSIGIAFCGMFGYRSPAEQGNFPLTQKQCEAGWKLGAELCKKYGITPDQQGVRTHYEVGQSGVSGSRGKIDITFLPFEKNLSASQIGEYIRNKVRWYLQRA